MYWYCVKNINLIVIITYYYIFFSCFLEKISFHQLLTTYYKDIGVDVRINQFHQVKDIKLIVIITYYSEVFEKMSFHHPLTSFYKAIGVAVI